MTLVELGDTARELAREVLIHGPISRAELGRRLGSPASLTRLSSRSSTAGSSSRRPTSCRARRAGRPVRSTSRSTPADSSASSSAATPRTACSPTCARARSRSTPRVAEPRPRCGRRDRRRARRRAHAGRRAPRERGCERGRQRRRAAHRDPRALPEWRDVALADLLEARLGVPVDVENDVTALTTAEQWFGPARGHDAFAVVTIGAGVGYGLVMHDRVVTTPDTGLGLGGHCRSTRAARCAARVIADARPRCCRFRASARRSASRWVARWATTRCWPRRAIRSPCR